jgi:hypothetical protein
MTATNVIWKNAAGGSHPDHPELPGAPSLLIFNSYFLISRVCASFSRGAVSSKNSPRHQKSSLDAFLSMILCDFIRPISSDFD